MRDKRNGLDELTLQNVAAVQIQKIARARSGRARFERHKVVVRADRKRNKAVKDIQRTARGRRGRVRAHEKRRDARTRTIQRVARGMIGRRIARSKRKNWELDMKGREAAIKIQATYRMHRGVEAYRELQVLHLGAVQVQRVWRGWLGRRRAMKKREWENAQPGPARLQLGVSMIEGAREAFERQRIEIDTLHRAQERKEMEISSIHAGLRESESELQTLKRELREVDQMDRDLHDLTHDKVIRRGGAGGHVSWRDAMRARGISSRWRSRRKKSWRRCRDALVRCVPTLCAAGVCRPA